MTPTPDPTCDHHVINTWSGNLAGRLWACGDCKLRFYPACLVCVDVGHRNVDHPALAQPAPLLDHKHEPVTHPGIPATNAWCRRCGYFPLPLEGARLLAPDEDAVAQPAPPLDVERLARAMRAYALPMPRGAVTSFRADWRHAEAIAREYAALSEPKP